MCSSVCFGKGAVEASKEERGHFHKCDCSMRETKTARTGVALHTNTTFWVIILFIYLCSSSWLRFSIFLVFLPHRIWEPEDVGSHMLYRSREVLNMADIIQPRLHLSLIGSRFKPKHNICHIPSRLISWARLSWWQIYTLACFISQTSDQRTTIMRSYLKSLHCNFL